MMDVYMIQYNCQSKCLVVINENTYVSVRKDENYNIDQPFLYFQPQIFFWPIKGL